MRLSSFKIDGLILARDEGSNIKDWLQDAEKAAITKTRVGVCSESYYFVMSNTRIGDLQPCLEQPSWQDDRCCQAPNASGLICWQPQKLQNPAQATWLVRNSQYATSTTSMVLRKLSSNIEFPFTSIMFSTAPSRTWMTTVSHESSAPRLNGIVDHEQSFVPVPQGVCSFNGFLPLVHDLVVIFSSY